MGEAGFDQVPLVAAHRSAGEFGDFLLRPLGLPHGLRACETMANARSSDISATVTLASVDLDMACSLQWRGWWEQCY